LYRYFIETQATFWFSYFFLLANVLEPFYPYIGYIVIKNFFFEIGRNLGPDKSIFSRKQGEASVFTLRECTQSIPRMILPLYRSYRKFFWRLTPKWFFKKFTMNYNAIVSNTLRVVWSWHAEILAKLCHHQNNKSKLKEHLKK
jgi:hypothetical protein